MAHSNLTGVVLSEVRRPVADQGVAVSVLREVADGSESVPLAQVVTDADGYFRAPLDTASFEGVRAPLEISWVRNGRTSFYFLDAIRYDETAPWQLNLPALESLIPNDESQLGFDLPLQTDAGLATLDNRLRDLLGIAQTAEEVAMTVDLPSLNMTTSTQVSSPDPVESEETQMGGSNDAVPADYTDLTAGAPALQAVASAAGSPCPTGYSSMWVPLRDQYKYPYVPTRFMRTLDKSSQEYVIGRTNETSLGISLDLDGKKYAGGLTGSADNKDGYTAVAEIGNGACHGEVQVALPA